MDDQNDILEKVKKIEIDIENIKEYFEKSLAYKSTHPDAALWMARKAIEAICLQIFIKEISPNIDTSKPKLDEIVNKLANKKIIPKGVMAAIRTIQSFANIATHHQPEERDRLTSEHVEPCLKSLAIVVTWYVEDYLSFNSDKPHYKKPEIQQISEPQKSWLSFRNLILIATCLSIMILTAILYQNYKRANSDQAANEELARLWRLGDYVNCYSEARKLQNKGSIDVSIPIYWRIVSYRDMNRIKWEENKEQKAISEVELEFEKGLRDAPQEGSKTDDILYQLGHFYRKTGKSDEALLTFLRIREKYPNSNWKEGTAYYLGKLYAKNKDIKQSNAMLDVLKSYDLTDRLYDFDSMSFITVREAISKLDAEIVLISQNTSL